MTASSEHRALSISHRGYEVHISYWIDYDSRKKIVDWSVRDPNQGAYGSTVNHGGYVREPLGGQSGIFGFGARPEKSFHELIAEGVEQGVQYINSTMERAELPPEGEIKETLALRGYEADD